MSKLVEFKEVVKKYDAVTTVNYLTLDIEEGEVFGLLGPNGAGKSTTISMLSGLVEMSGGDIVVGGFSVKKSPIDVKRQIGIVPQDLALYETLSARENVTFFGKLYGLRGKLLQERVDEALQFVGLTDRAKDKPSTFSGGMKRRLNIACAIVHRPKLIVMDEPTVGIDPQSRNHILESVRELNRLGSTIIYTSHYMEEVEAICTRVGIIDRGKLIALGTKEQLILQSGQEDKLEFELDRDSQDAVSEISSHPRVNNVKQVDERHLEIGIKDSPTVLQDLLFILNKHNVTVRKLTRIEPGLETLFLQLTGRSLRDA
ncbi:ABC transporter ATP-binding protein [Paenibacillus xylaniclasticus]|uniref:ABC transporter ATP-binding protein n=1 Tax=Paenibacillus xylaniclasticus TaxID=588083 RepID=UPI000FDB1A34|nr:MULTISPECIES: ABC transporter ATP-binding protein [Paenibacillus]GFN32042.1 antibiotic ABC transporter ATP-binding protein [Paenibacillus curdlanolyticus]